MYRNKLKNNTSNQCKNEKDIYAIFPKFLKKVFHNTSSVAVLYVYKSQKMSINKSATHKGGTVLSLNKCFPCCDTIPNQIGGSICMKGKKTQPYLVKNIELCRTSILAHFMKKCQLSCEKIKKRQAKHLSFTLFNIIFACFFTLFNAN